MTKPKVNGVNKNDPNNQLIEFPNIGKSITLERVLKAKRLYLYKYTKIETENDKSIEIVEYFDHNRYYKDKVPHYITPDGHIMYKDINIVQSRIDRLINFKHNKPVIITGKGYKIFIYTESRNILVGNTGGCKLVYLDKPYINGTNYIISYSDTQEQERRFFNEFQ